MKIPFSIVEVVSLGSPHQTLSAAQSKVLPNFLVCALGKALQAACWHLGKSEGWQWSGMSGVALASKLCMLGNFLHIILMTFPDIASSPLWFAIFLIVAFQEQISINFPYSWIWVADPIWHWERKVSQQSTLVILTWQQMSLIDIHKTYISSTWGSFERTYIYYSCTCKHSQ